LIERAGQAADRRRQISEQRVDGDAYVRQRRQDRRHVWLRRLHGRDDGAHARGKVFETRGDGRQSAAGVKDDVDRGVDGDGGLAQCREIDADGNAPRRPRAAPRRRAARGHDLQRVDRHFYAVGQLQRHGVHEAADEIANDLLQPTRLTEELVDQRGRVAASVRDHLRDHGADPLEADGHLGGHA
jgi:hypothetical protein